MAITKTKEEDKMKNRKTKKYSWDGITYEAPANWEHMLHGNFQFHKFRGGSMLVYCQRGEYAHEEFSKEESAHIILAEIVKVVMPTIQLLETLDDPPSPINIFAGSPTTYLRLENGYYARRNTFSYVFEGNIFVGIVYALCTPRASCVFFILKSSNVRATKGISEDDMTDFMNIIKSVNLRNISREQQ